MNADDLIKRASETLAWANNKTLSVSDGLLAANMAATLAIAEMMAEQRKPAPTQDAQDELLPCSECGEMPDMAESDANGMQRVTARCMCSPVIYGPTEALARARWNAAAAIKEA